jgi:uncharacterized circularly permuted ATP-grasp superfamily protein
MSKSALLDAYRAGAICMVNSFRGKLVHKKAIFAVLTNERYSHLFDEHELSAISAHVPWTRKFRNERTQVRVEIQNPKSKIQNREEVDLVSWTRANSARLVLKPNDDYGGHGIYIGWNSSESEWDEAIKTALANGDYLVQERVKTAKEMFPMMFDDLGKWGMVEQARRSRSAAFQRCRWSRVHASIKQRARECFERRRYGADIYHRREGMIRVTLLARMTKTGKSF